MTEQTEQSPHTSAEAHVLQRGESIACNPHPDAPHGFCRSSSHSAGRYVCECEGWTPEEDEAWIEKLRDLAGMTS